MTDVRTKNEEYSVPVPVPRRNNQSTGQSSGEPVVDASGDPLAVMFSSTFQTPDGVIYWEMRTEQDRNQYLKIKHQINEELVDPPVCTLTMNTEEAQVSPHELEFSDVLKPINLSSTEALTQFSVSPQSRMEWKTFLKTHQVHKSAKVQGIASITYSVKNVDSEEITTHHVTFGVGWRTTRDAKRRGSLLEAALGSR